MQLDSVRRSRRLQLARSFFVQTHLLNPGFGGTGKWSIVLPSTRKAYQAAQIDRHRNPPLFDLLASVSAGDDPNGPDVDRLMTAGMVEVENGASAEPASFTGLFHQFVTDYPFYDYSDPQWLDDDIQRMRDFKEAEPPPPISTPRPDLKAIEPSSGKSADGRDGTADDLAAIIEGTFGAVGAIEGFPVGPWHRKAMPSGGARHPVEAWVDLPRSIGWLPAGLHVYDVAGNVLRQTGEASRCRVGADEMANPPVVVYLRARVDRAMWRYRDARSWRAILVDAGHCAQMLATNAELRGFQVEVCTPPRGVDGDHDWLDEPWLLAVVLRTDASGKTLVATEQEPPASVADDEHVVTQPFLYGTFAAGRMVVHDLASGASPQVIDELDLAIMTHCLYSRRDDRPSDAASVEKIFGPDGPDRRAALVAAGLLWQRKRGHDLMKAVCAWSDKGWYLTALAHADVRSAGSRATLPLPGDLGLSSADVERIAQTRQTCRSFDSAYVLPRETFDVLLASLRSLLSVSPFDTTVIVAPTSVDGVSSAFYRWQNEQLEPMPGIVDQSAIRDATIGQSPAGSGAMTLWVTVAVDNQDPGSYELRAATLGMLGQRLCLMATNLGLGVFVTPAVKDSETSALFDFDLSNAVTYTVTIGAAAR